jgi:hypothetical protein
VKETFILQVHRFYAATEVIQKWYLNHWLHEGMSVSPVEISKVIPITTGKTGAKAV